VDKQLIKVLNILTDTNIGGAGKALLSFMAKTNRDEFDHTVVVPENSLISPHLRELGIKVVEMPGIADKSMSFGAVRAFRKVYKKLDPGLIHTHASLSARAAARLWNHKRPVIYTRHCAYPQGKLKTTFPMRQILGFINNRLSDRIIAISPAARDNLIETGADSRKITTMFNGVEPVRRLTDEEKSAARAAFGIGREDFACSIIARLVPEKGHLYILEAAGLLRELPIRFIIAGAGPFESELRAAATALYLDNCVFTGFVDDVSVIENITDLQLNASYGTETSSLSLLEGMSLGTPAVASDYGGNPHLITSGENGLIVPRQDGAALAGAIRRLYNDQETLARMGDNAQRIYSDRFTAEIMAAGIERVYREAMTINN